MSGQISNVNPSTKVNGIVKRKPINHETQTKYSSDVFLLSKVYFCYPLYSLFISNPLFIAFPNVVFCILLPPSLITTYVNL